MAQSCATSTASVAVERVLHRTTPAVWTHLDPEAGAGEWLRHGYLPAFFLPPSTSRLVLVVLLVALVQTVAMVDIPDSRRSFEPPVVRAVLLKTVGIPQVLVVVQQATFCLVVVSTA